MISQKPTSIVMLLASTYITDPRVRNEAESLRDFGYKITVLSWDRSGKQPRNYESQGISVVSFRLLHGTTFSKFRFAISALLFQFVCVLWCLRNTKTGSIIIHSHDFNTLVAAVSAKILLPGSGLIYDSHELTPAVFSEWYGPKTGTVASAMERSFLPFVDKVITVSPPIQRYLSGITNKPVFLIYNTIRLSDVPRQDKKWWRVRYGLDRFFVVSHVGNLREDTAVEALIEAARKCALFENNIRFVVVGDGPQLGALRKLAYGVEEYVKFLPRVSHELALGYVKASDITYAVYKDMGDNTRIAMPWKVFESMACGTPVLVREGTYTWQFVRSLGVGLSAGEGAPEEITDRIIWAFEHRDSLRSISMEGEKNFISKFNWDNMARTLLEIYRS